MPEPRAVGPRLFKTVGRAYERGGSEVESTVPATGASPRCRSCGTELQGQFCYACGRKHVLPSRPLGHFVRDAFEGALDGAKRLLASLRTLVTRPGQLTLDFLQGHHQALIDPIRLFINVGVGSFLATRVLPSDIALFGVGPVLFGDEPSLAAWLTAALGIAAAALAHWLVLRRRRPYLIDSAVFVLHVTAFSFLLAPLSGLLSLLFRLAAPGFVLIAELVPVVALALYWVFALRRFNSSDRHRNALDVLLIYGVFVLLLLPLTLFGL